MRLRDLARDRRAILGIALVAVLLRLLASAVLRAWSAPDSMESGQIAEGLVAGRGFVWADFGYAGPSSVQSPTYPFFLAGLFLLFGSGSALAYGVALAVNALLGGVAALGVATMTRQLGGRDEEALVAAALFAVWPTQIYAATHAQAIVLITACTVWMVALFLEAERDSRVRPWLAFSLVSLLASLTEPTLLPITALSVPWMFVTARAPLGTRARRVALTAFCAVLVMGPWTVRNWRVHGAFIPVKNSFWVNVWKGANDHATGTDRLQMSEELRAREREGTFSIRDSRGEQGEPPHQYDALTPEQREELTGKTEIEREKIFRRYALTWIAAHPQRFFELCATRLWKTLWIDTDNPKGNNVLYPLSRALVLLLGIPGLVIAATRRWRLLYPLALYASCVGVYTLTLTAARFAIPLEPLQLAVGATTVVGLLSLAARGSPARTAAGR